MFFLAMYIDTVHVEPLIYSHNTIQVVVHECHRSDLDLGAPLKIMLKVGIYRDGGAC